MHLTLKGQQGENKLIPFHHRRHRSGLDGLAALLYGHDSFSWIPRILDGNVKMCEYG